MRITRDYYIIHKNEEFRHGHIKKHYPTHFSVNSDSRQVKTFIAIQVCYLSDNREIKARPIKEFIHVFNIYKYNDSEHYKSQKASFCTLMRCISNYWRKYSISKVSITFPISL